MFEIDGDGKGGGVDSFSFRQVLHFVLFCFIREILLAYPNDARPLCMAFPDHSWQRSPCWQKH